MLVAMVLVVTIVITSDCGHYCHHVGGHAWLMLVALVLVVVHSGGEDHHHCHCCVVVGVDSSGAVVVPLVVIAASHCHHIGGDQHWQWLAFIGSGIGGVGDGARLSLWSLSARTWWSLCQW